MHSAARARACPPPSPYGGSYAIAQDVGKSLPRFILFLVSRFLDGDPDGDLDGNLPNGVLCDIQSINSVPPCCDR